MSRVAVPDSVLVDIEYHLVAVARIFDFGDGLSVEVMLYDCPTAFAYVLIQTPTSPVVGTFIDVIGFEIGAPAGGQQDNHHNDNDEERQTGATTDGYPHQIVLDERRQSA